MKRIYGDYVYGSGPRENCYWATTCELPDMPHASGEISCDVAIIGAGFTGLNAAIVLAERGRDVVVLDANEPAWGASGRNGGFCCLGGGKLSDRKLDKLYGREGRLSWRRAEKKATEHVAAFIEAADVDVDRHSDGETWLAHRAKDMAGVEKDAREMERNYGVSPILHSSSQLEDAGMSAGFFGGMTIPVGFGLNPVKYLRALLLQAIGSGARVFSGSAATAFEPDVPTHRIAGAGFAVTTRQVLFATNGYSSENLPAWFAGRYLPVQSSVLVTRPLLDHELEEQGWTSHQMCYDSRNLLHYFRLMPDQRMLFGMRGGLRGTARGDGRAKARLEASFRAMFPNWREVDAPYSWSGMVSMSAGALPLVGEMPGLPNAYCAMNYHGNGVAMGSYAGHIAALKMVNADTGEWPRFAGPTPRKFPLGQWRRAVLWPAYAALQLADL